MNKKKICFIILIFLLIILVICIYKKNSNLTTTTNTITSLLNAYNDDDEEIIKQCYGGADINTEEICLNREIFNQVDSSSIEINKQKTYWNDSKNYVIGVSYSFVKSASNKVPNYEIYVLRKESNRYFVELRSNYSQKIFSVIDKFEEAKSEEVYLDFQTRQEEYNKNHQEYLKYYKSIIDSIDIVQFNENTELLKRNTKFMLLICIAAILQMSILNIYLLKRNKENATKISIKNTKRNFL